MSFRQPEKHFNINNLYTVCSFLLLTAPYYLVFLKKEKTAACNYTMLPILAVIIIPIYILL